VKTDDLIDLLAKDLRPGWPFARIVSVAALCGVLVAAAVFFSGIGFRSDIPQALESVRFLFKFVVTITLVVGATGGAIALSRPGVGIERWGWVLAAVPILLLCAVGLELSAVPESAWMGQLVGHNARFCLTLIPLLAIGPFVCLFIALRRGAPTKPRLTGALAGLAASGIAATFYASYCTDDSPLFLATWYPLATLIVAAVGYLAGDRLLRW
jgi:hypothetical protein